MKISFLDGRIVADGYFYEDVPYDVSANNLSVCFDGKGGLTKYLSVRSGKNYSQRSMFSLYKNGEQIGAYTKKQTRMAGRIQEICLFGDGYRVKMKQFITKEDDAVFVDMTFVTDESTDFTVIYGIGDSWVIPAFSCAFPYRLEQENMRFELNVNVCGEKHIQFVVAYEENQAYCDWLLASFQEKAEMARKEIDDIVLPPSAQTEEEKALYLSALFCSLENYKECGGLKGFVAGCHYLNPLRTYYRDSYWTILPMYAYDITFVKRQVLTLARGIDKDGSCPSAVKQDFSAFWGGHYDSPSFFAMMVYDYVNHSGDKAFLQEEVNGKTILDLCRLVVTKQIERTDETGLLYKEGPFNKLDWADEVNRNGYVTYDEALFFRL